MKIRSIIYLPFIILLAGSACEESTEPEPRSGAYELYQVPGCQGSLEKAVFEDSCFTYQFEEDLNFEFCVTANCCPDSNRFELTCEVREDTIAVTVLDTTDRSRWCWCICRYLIVAELFDLPLERYTIHITADTYYDTPTYQESVRRND